MKLKNVFAKYGSSMMALALVAIAGQMASRVCYYCFYQPEEPAALQKLIKK